MFLKLLGMKTVVFDLDETLIHCNDSTDEKCDVVLAIKFPTGEIIDAGINIRPYAKKLLQTLNKHFEVIVFTASHCCYANVVLDYLDPDQKLIQHRLFRKNCVQTEDSVYLKDLRVLLADDRKIEDIVLVDNAAYSFVLQVENGVPIIPFYNEKSDQELKRLEKYLLKMVK